MNVTGLRERISAWEDLHTDFKEQIDSADELAKDLVCFANTDGGQLILGVADDRSISGIDDVDATNRSVDNVAFDNCNPPVTVVQEVLEVDGSRVVVVNVPKGDQRPYSTIRGRYYVRTTSGCRPASRQELLRLFQATESLYYDETTLPRLGVGDLDLDSVDRYLEKTGQSGLDAEQERLLRNWGLLSGRTPTIAGLVLFGREPQRHLPFAQINAARFPGRDSSVDPSDRKDLTGRLLDVVADTERFLSLHLRRPHDIQGFE
jgi:ATP-dependent DNA helicase RecG